MCSLSRNQDILIDMLIYQANTNVKGQCWTHALLYSDCVNFYKDNTCKPVAGVLHYYDEEKKANVVVSHCWCMINNKVIETSYEYVKIKCEKNYYTSLKTFFETHIGFLPNEKKEIVQNVAKFNITILKAVRDTKLTTSYYKEIIPSVSRYMIPNENYAK